MKRGVHPLTNKITEGSEIRDIKIPDKLYIYMSQHIGAECKPLVKKGEKVERFQKIGESDQYVSTPLHSPVDGTVEDIIKHEHPVGHECDCIVIRPDKKKYEEPTTNDAVKYNGKDALNIIRDMGIVGLGGAMFPTHVKLSPPEGKKIDTIIINGAECEPYLTADSQLMIEHAKEIVKGIEIIHDIIDAQVIIGIEDNKKKSIKALQEAVSEHDYLIKALPVKYPQGAEKALIKSLTGRIVPAGGLPMDIGVVVCNVGTVFSIYEAIYKQKPIVERVVTVTGDVKKPGNFRTMLGTTFNHLVKAAGGYAGKPNVVMCGGPMMGIAQKTDAVGLIKGNNGILVFNEDRKFPDSTDCIRCGKCIDVCPMNLVPKIIATYSKNKKFDLAADNHAMDCFECGCCNYACPSKIDILGLIKQSKAEIRRKKDEK
ncbi:electron transport complex subunit RsxC [Candidatus Woesearchaeota archaeon]|nr:electron transport complex subunit RsxC [Candidatus Woesearchaeota archaeon]